MAMKGETDPIPSLPELRPAELRMPIGDTRVEQERLMRSNPVNGSSEPVKSDLARYGRRVAMENRRCR